MKRVFRLIGGFSSSYKAGFCFFELFPWVVCQILVQILQTMFLGVSSFGRVFFNNLCETYIKVIVWLLSFFSLV